MVLELYLQLHVIIVLALTSDPPNPPINVLVDDITKASAKLTWEPPEFDGGSPITGYIIERQNGFSSRWSKLTKEPITEQQLEMTDLREKEQYDLRVSAVNAAGISKPSPTTGKFTAKDPFEKPGKPGTPEVGEITKGVATLNWKAPESDGGAEITNYIVEMRVNRGKWAVVNKDETVPDTTFQVQGLKEGEEVEFRVTAENKAGPGPASNPSKPIKYGRL